MISPLNFVVVSHLYRSLPPNKKANDKTSATKAAEARVKACVCGSGMLVVSA